MESTATQYDLVCEQKSMIKNLYSLGFFGYLCSQLYSGVLADKFGRKPVILASYMLASITAFAIATFNNMGVNVYAAGRFLLMFFNFGNNTW